MIRLMVNCSCVELFVTLGIEGDPHVKQGMQRGIKEESTRTQTVRG